MFPSTSQDFLRIADQRLRASRILFENDALLDAQYLAGYVVECSIKAVILKHTPAADRTNMLQTLTAGARMHRSEVLLQILQGLGIRVGGDLTKRHRRFVSQTWSPSLRYQVGRRDAGETRGFLKTVSAFYEWAEGELS